MTRKDHSLAYGIVIRGIECIGTNKYKIHNYGEGSGRLQSFGPISDMAVNNVWYWHTEKALEDITNKKYVISSRGPEVTAIEGEGNSLLPGRKDWTEEPEIP